MAKQSISDEVQVLRFFEASPIEKASAVFNIVAEKMRERLRGANQEHDRPTPSGLSKRRNASGNPKAPAAESENPCTPG